MTQLEQWLTALGVGGGWLGLVAFLLAHATKVAPALGNLVKVLEGGTISVQQVEGAVKGVDPALYDAAQRKILALEADAKDFETKVQAEAAKRLASLVASLNPDPAPVKVDTPPSDPVPVAPPVPGA